MHVFNSTGVVLAKGTLWKEWADFEFPAMLSHVRDTYSDVPCPSLPFIEAINKQRQSKKKTKVPKKKQVSHPVVGVDDDQSMGLNSDFTETSTEESNKLEEDNSEEDIFDSVEHLNLHLRFWMEA